MSLPQDLRDRWRAGPASRLTLEQLERLEERAAIIEYDGNRTRAEAEAAALAEILSAGRPGAGG